MNNKEKYMSYHPTFIKKLQYGLATHIFVISVILTCLMIIFTFTLPSNTSSVGYYRHDKEISINAILAILALSLQLITLIVFLFIAFKKPTKPTVFFCINNKIIHSIFFIILALLSCGMLIIGFTAVLHSNDSTREVRNILCTFDINYGFRFTSLGVCLLSNFSIVYILTTVLGTFFTSGYFKVSIVFTKKTSDN